MKNRRAGKLFLSLIRLAISASLTLSPALLPGRGEQLADASGEADAGLRLLSSDSSGVTLEYVPPPPVVESRLAAGRRYHLFRVPGTDQRTEPTGLPQVPLRGVMLGIPPGAEVSLAITSLETEELPGTYNLLPAPTTVLRQEDRFGQQVNAGFEYVPDPAVYSSPALTPATPAVLGRISQFRSQRMVQVSLFPLQYRPASGQVTRVRRMTIALRFAYPRGMAGAAAGRVDEGDFERLLAGQLFNYEQARGWWEAPGASALAEVGGAPGSHRIKIRGSGIYRLTGAALKAAGVPAATDPRTLKIYKNGVEVPTTLSYASAGELGDADYLEFYGQELENRYTETNVYWLAYGGAEGLRMSERNVAPDGSPPGASAFLSTVRLEENHYYTSQFATSDGDYWFWGVLHTVDLGRPFFYYPGLTAQLDLPGVSSEAGLMATLRLSLYGASCPDCEDALSRPHHPRVRINGNLVFDQVLVGDIHHLAGVQFSQSVLNSGENTIEITNLPLDPGVEWDSSFPDWIEIDYYQTFTASDDQLAFRSEAEEAVALEITGFSSPELALYDVSDPGAPVRLVGGAPAGGGPYTLTFRDTIGGRSYWAHAAGAALAPEAIEPDTSTPDLISTANGADEIIIVYDDFYGAVARLKALREGEGLRVQVVRISDIYDEFSDGVFNPEAIAVFLEYAFSHWQTPAPAYVLLVGDGNLNYRNFQGNSLGDSGTSAPNEVNYVPPMLVEVDPWLGQVASDNRHVMLTPPGAAATEKDLMPDMAIGRLPARSLAEAQAMVGKIVNYESSPPPGESGRTVDFFADNFRRADGSVDGAGDFQQFTEDLITGFIPENFTVERVYYDPSVPTAPPSFNTVGEVQGEILSRLNAGALIVNYIGHASRAQWAHENLFDVNQIDSLKYSAVADWTATGLGVATGHDVLARGFYEAVFSNGVTRIGLATNAGKLLLNAYAQHRDLMDTYVLFGDPAMNLALPAGAASASAAGLLVIIEQTCFTGQFAWPGTEVLAEKWMRANPYSNTYLPVVQK